MTKEQLETNLAALKLLQNETNDKLADHKVQISLLEKQLEDINKPELTPMQLDNIHNAIEKAVDDFSFDDIDNYDKEFGMEYDGKVYLESLDMTCTYELVEAIVDKVHNLFKEAECPTDENENNETNQ